MLGRKILLFSLLAFLTIGHVFGQTPQDSTNNRRLLSPSVSFFVPHWYIKAQGGVSYDVGEASFDQLISPGLQLSMGYQFNEYFGLRGGVSGLWARNRYAYPEASYKWNFIQPAVDAELNLTPLFFGLDPERHWHFYGFAGLGAAYAFGNDDAVEASKRYGVDFEKLWEKSRWNMAVRGGLGFDYAVTDNIAIGAEVNANMLPDHFNSKLGRKDNSDWHFNALIGVKFTIGHSHGRIEARYAEPAPIQPKPDTVFIDVPIEKLSFNVNIFFVINRSDIRSNQMQKLSRLIAYLDAHPKAFVRLSGYADRQEWRIRRFAKGDRVQPFDIPQDNRVCICYVYDPDHPERIDNWY